MTMYEVVLVGEFFSIFQWVQAIGSLWENFGTMVLRLRLGIPFGFGKPPIWEKLG